MEKTVYKFIYGLKEKIMLFMMLALFGVTTLVDLFRLIGLFGMTPYNFALDLIGLLFSIVMFTFIMITLFFSKYVIQNGILTEKIGVFSTKIPCSRIAKFISIDSDGTLFMLYTAKKSVPKQLKINVHKSERDDFLSTLRSINTNILYESYNGEEE